MKQTTNRWRNYGLWLSIAAFIPLLLSSFGFNVLPANYQEIISAFLGILVMAGIINDPNTSRKWFLDDSDTKEQMTKKE